MLGERGVPMSYRETFDSKLQHVKLRELQKDREIISVPIVYRI